MIQKKIKITPNANQALDVEITLEATLTIREWKQVIDCIYPSKQEAPSLFKGMVEASIKKHTEAVTDEYVYNVGDK